MALEVLDHCPETPEHFFRLLVLQTGEEILEQKIVVGCIMRDNLSVEIYETFRRSTALVRLLIVKFITV